MLVIKRILEAVGKLQQGGELRAVKRALARLPVHKVACRARHALAQHVRLGVGDVKVRRVWLELCQRVLCRVHRPLVVAVHDLTERHRRGDGKRIGDLIQPVPGLHRLQRLRKKLVAGELGVGVDVLPQLLQHALGGVLRNGKLVGADHIGDIAGEDLGVELGQTRGVILVRIILRIIAHDNPVFVARAVKSENLGAQRRGQIQARERQLLLFRHRRRVGRREHGDLPAGRARARGGGGGIRRGGDVYAADVVAVAAGRVAQDGADLAGIVHIDAVEGVAVHVAGEPVHELFLLAAVGLIAIQGGAVVVEEVVLAVSGQRIPRAVRQCDGLAPAL